MRVSAATPKRELVMVLEGGDELRLSLKDLCLQEGMTSLLISGVGRARRVDLAGAKGGSRHVEGPVDALHVWGTVELAGKALDLDARIVLGRAGDINGGILRDAAFDRAVFRVTELSGPLDPTIPEPPAEVAKSGPAKAGPASWASVAAASEGLGQVRTAEDRPPKAGDWVDHPTFGRCSVVRLSDEHLRVRRDSGRTISLGLARIRLTLSGEMSDGKHVYALEVVKSGR